MCTNIVAKFHFLGFVGYILNLGFLKVGMGCESLMGSDNGSLDLSRTRPEPI